MDRQEVIAVLDLFMVGQQLATHWESYRERIANALMELEGGDEQCSASGIGDVSPTQGEQASGALLARHLPCPVFTDMLFAALQKVRGKVITGPEQRAVDDCLQAVRDLITQLGGPVVAIACKPPEDR